MKSLAVLSALFVAASLGAQTASEIARGAAAPAAPAAAVAPAPAAPEEQAPALAKTEDGQPMVRIATLGSVESNSEFQRNVQIVQAQRAQVVELQRAQEAETDEAKKAELQQRIDAMLIRLNENNAKMTEAYGFSLLRDYTLVVERAHIYMHLSDEEAAKVEAELRARGVIPAAAPAAPAAP